MFSFNPPRIGEGPSPPEERTVFLGDLSVYCTEEDISSYFRAYGTIEKIRIKHAVNNKNLSYAFLTFTTKEASLRVIENLNGKVFLGRALR
jgi:RNA recognition motif-containing protein